MAEARSERTESERYRAFTYDEIVARDKTNVDTAWLRDESREDMVSSLAPAILAREIVEDLTAALPDFEAVTAALEAGARASLPIENCRHRARHDDAYGGGTASCRPGTRVG